MNTHGRVLNRIVLAVLALVAFAVATMAAWPFLTGAPVPLVGAAAGLPETIGITRQVAAWVIVGALCVAVVGALVVILTRPPRGTRTALDTGGVTIDTAVIEGVFTDALGASPDVIGVSSSTSLRRGRRMVALRVQVRPRADLAAVFGQVQAALATTDRRLGVALPTSVQLTGGIRTTFAHDRRVV